MNRKAWPQPFSTSKSKYCISISSTRSALNTDAEDTPLSTMVHVWQLKTREDFDKADYDTLFMQEEKTLEKNVLAKHTVWVKPEGTASLNVPLDKETQFVAINWAVLSP